jgi:hypothetical protein
VNSDNLTQLIIAVVGSSLASSGFWAWVTSKTKNRSAVASLMMGFAYNQIVTMGVAYLERKWITREEYQELVKYYYEPYRKLGGNGVAESIMVRVNLLPIVNQSKYESVLPTNHLEEPTNVRIVAAAPPVPAE